MGEEEVNGPAMIRMETPEGTGTWVALDHIVMIYPQDEDVSVIGLRSGLTLQVKGNPDTVMHTLSGTLNPDQNQDSGESDESVSTDL